MPTKRTSARLLQLGLFVFLSSTMMLVSNRTGNPSVSGPSKELLPVESSLAAQGDSTWWSELLIAGQPAGFGIMSQQRHDSNQQLWTQVVHITTQRNGQPTQQRLSWNCLQDCEGGLIQFTLSVADGESERFYEGVRNGETLTVTNLPNDRNQKSAKSIAITARCGGFAAIEQSLLTAPMIPGESRALAMLLPLINRVAPVQLLAKEVSTLVLPDGTCCSNALRIEQTTELENGKHLQAELWTDRKGHILQSKVSALRQLVARTSRTHALQTHNAPAPDICRLAQWTVAGASPDTNKAATATYFWERSPDVAIKNRFHQTARPTSDGIEIAVQSTLGMRWPNLATNPKRKRLPSSRLDSIPVEIRVAAERATPGMTAPWSIAKRLERFVFDHIRCKDYSCAFSTAEETLRSRTGDCSEHAVLLAELCRALQIRARVVLGLAHVEQSLFQIHMWNEVFIQGQWRPLDATLAMEGIPATHISLDQSESSFPQPLMLAPATWNLPSSRITLIKKNQGLVNSPDIFANRIH